MVWGLTAGFCFLRAQCAINIESPNDKLNTNLSLVANELAKVRDKGLSEEEFTAPGGAEKSRIAKAVRDLRAYRY
ncbi:zinc-protease [Salmonella enterica subsp. enterica]|uniref:Zinc-protease n=1 Tax=Salmonella enterica I TaxID=59201 RepID=A0A447TT32_SALET|nr:zinc-protease [Salmonella enterica subsp. enterica]